jgi:hypothetical protein
MKAILGYAPSAEIVRGYYMVRRLDIADLPEIVRSS